MADDFSIADFSDGMRIEAHPATDAWMSGDKYGEVQKVGRKYVHVKMDKSGRTLRFSPANIGNIIR